VGDGAEEGGGAGVGALEDGALEEGVAEEGVVVAWEPAD
jgi:hypothetical protein